MPPDPLGGSRLRFRFSPLTLKCAPWALGGNAKTNILLVELMVSKLPTGWLANDWVVSRALLKIHGVIFMV